MKRVAKLIIINPEGKYLMLYRNNHPAFGNDPDIPGGIVEPGETLNQATAREAHEEVGAIINPDNITKLYEGDEYSTDNTLWVLFSIHAIEDLVIKMSWEHLSHTWLSKEEFIKEANSANDTYMHMVGRILKSSVAMN